MAANLRVAVASVPPVLALLRQTMHLSVLGTALLAALPVLCFAALSPLAAVVGARLGLKRALGAAMAGLTAGLVLRLGPGAPTLYAGTIVAAGSVALMNVLLPALVKRAFPGRTGLLTGLYATALGVGAALSAGLSAPLAASALGWRGALGLWALTAVAALVLWQVVHVPEEAASPPLEAMARRPAGSVWRDRVVWQVTWFMGLQSLGYYAILSWLPAIAASRGLSAGQGGLLLSLATVVGLPLGLLLPALAGRRHDQRALVGLTSALTATGLLGLALGGRDMVVWTVALGMGQGASFPLALTLIGLRTRHSADTAALSTFAQSGGYALAALGPLVVALLHEATGGWSWPIGFLLAATAAQWIAGLGAGSYRFAFPAEGDERMAQVVRPGA